MIDSALGLDLRDDHSRGGQGEAAAAPRSRRTLDGITFVAKIAVEPSTDARYPDKNKLDRHGAAQRKSRRR